MWPSAGGQYVWAAELAPKKYKALIVSLVRLFDRKLLRSAHTLFPQSWYVAWISIAGLWLGGISSSMGVTVQIQSYVAITQAYDMKRWHAFLVHSWTSA